MAKNTKSKENYTYLVMDSEGCTGVGYSLIEAANNLYEASNESIMNFTYYKLTKINVELKEV